jgi:uncharacterized membrane protein
MMCNVMLKVVIRQGDLHFVAQQVIDAFLFSDIINGGMVVAIERFQT